MKVEVMKRTQEVVTVEDVNSDMSEYRDRVSANHDVVVVSEKQNRGVRFYLAGDCTVRAEEV